MPSVSAAEIYAAWPDDRFPYMSGVRATEGLLIELPYRGNQLHIRCLACGREGHIAGRRIAVDFTRHLAFTVARFISSLRCSDCKSRRLLVHDQRDPGSSGFQRSTQDDAWTISTRRLNTWLSQAGADVWAFADILEGMPSRAVFEAAEAGGPADGA